jgi:hypothetical protein
MKRILLVALLALGSAPTAKADTPFCTGYQTGYQRGWCAGQFGCIPPIPPICPIPNVGQDSYQDGYDRGYADGQDARP